MAVPRKKVTRSKRNMRRAHDSLTAPNLVECDNCNEPKLPHHICGECGYYAGRLVVAPKVDEYDDEDDAA
ncbi:MAG: 50S ribosomal protein L32 [Neomegalonema sp.]|nr:50S ribosomal protein L32 [Neomegalonema sp.]